jgi:phosphoglycerate dehydrogenase-like enzyme
MTPDVLCLRPRVDFERANALPPAALAVAYRSPDDSDLPSLMKQARALVIPAVGSKLSMSLFENSTIQFVQVTGAGLDRLDLSVLKRLGIAVSNVPGGSNRAVSEYVLTAACLLLRRFAWADSEIRSGNYAAFRARMLEEKLSGLEDLLVGIIGLGTIGLAVAEAFHKFGCRLCYFDSAPRDPHAAATLGASPALLEDLLKSSDIVTLHLPLLPATQNLLAAPQLALMKPSAVLIQASRGGIVNESALADVLRSGRFAGAAIDVYSAEPPNANNPLFQLTGEAARRLLFTPHIAGVTHQSAEFLLRSAWRNVERVLITNQPPFDRVV